jgi:hypothetical protein
MPVARRRAQDPWRRCHRADRPHQCDIQGDPSYPSQESLCLLRRDCPGEHVEPADRARHRRTCLLAHILVSKFADHQPLYRQSAIHARAGVDLDRSTMASRIGACAALLRPLVETLLRYVLALGKFHADDTPALGLCLGRPQCVIGSATGGMVCLFVQSEGSSSAIASEPVQWCAAGRCLYNEVYADGRVREAACMAHARRKLHDLHVRRATAATTEALRRIGELYVIETQIRDHLISEGRYGSSRRGHSWTI